MSWATRTTPLHAPRALPLFTVSVLAPSITRPGRTVVVQRQYLIACVEEKEAAGAVRVLGSGDLRVPGHTAVVQRQYLVACVEEKEASGAVRVLGSGDLRVPGHTAVVQRQYLVACVEEKEAAGAVRVLGLIHAAVLAQQSRLLIPQAACD